MQHLGKLPNFCWLVHINIEHNGLLVLLAVVADPSICSEVGFVVGLEIFLVISPSPEDLSMAVVEVETVVVSESLVYPAEVDGVSG